MKSVDWVTLLGPWSDLSGPLHQRLSNAIRTAIENGLLVPGTRLPSERDLAVALTVSRNTVLTAYNTLRDASWLSSRTGGGTWVSNGSACLRAARYEVQLERFAQSNLMNVLGRANDDAIDFGSGTPYPLAGLPPDALTLSREENQQLQRTRLYYPFGLPALRQAIASHYTSNGLPTSVDQILVTSGAQQAIALIGSLFLQKGDTVLVEDPSYFGALEAFRATGARIQTLPVGPHGVEPRGLHDSVTAANARLIYLTPDFQNPTGTVMPARAREEIVAIGARRCVPIIDDRTLADIDFASAAGKPLATTDRSDNVLTIGSLGKLMWAGLRIGWIRAPRHWIERLVRLKMASDLGTSLPSQYLAAKLMVFHAEAKRLRAAELSAKRDLIAGLLEIELPGCQFSIPKGGLFLWMKLPQRTVRSDARGLAQVGLRNGVVLLPGCSMSAEQRHTDILRIPFLLDEDELREGVSRLAHSWDEYNSVSSRRAVFEAIT